MDVLLGEDETNPRNRLVLICQNCRLVNGQAPPGMKSLEELGRWRCGGCGAWNGAENETKKVLADIKSQTQSTEGAWETVHRKEEEVASSEEATDDGVIVGSDTKESEGEEDNIDEEKEPEPEQSPRKRGRPKGSRKKG
jgi:hypothetical protein